MEQALLCANCQSPSPFIEEYSHPNFQITELKRMQCENPKCPVKEWFYCSTCRKALRSNLRNHAYTQTHMQKTSSRFDDNPNDPKYPDNYPADTQYTAVASPNDPTYPHYPPDPEEAVPLALLQKSQEEDSTESDLEYSQPVSRFPQINLSGHEWIARATKDSPLATREEISSAFSHPDLAGMENYFLAERASNHNQNYEGYCGGGLLYLLARAFQGCSEDGAIDHNKYAKQEEALWHLRCITQYHMLTEKGRQREIAILRSLQPSLSTNNFLFTHTWIPGQKEAAKIYGSARKSSFWNSLPCPRVRLLADGVSYTPPRACIAFCLGNGIPIDDFKVTKEEVIAMPTSVHSVSDSPKAIIWKQEVQKAFYASENMGAPNTFGPKPPFVALLALSEWGDGFGPGKVKNNRNSVDLKTFTISPPKHTSNGLLNTFPVAIGLKSSKGWREAERQFQADLEELTTARSPIPFYHGPSKRIIYCCFKRFGVLADKQERNGLTGTLACTGDTHRCFGVSGQFLTPSCKVEDIKQFFDIQISEAKEPGFGWSDTFIQQTVNGHALPACKTCRKENLKKLGLQIRGSSSSSCGKCCNWEFFPEGNQQSSLLHFPAHKDYPTRAMEGCPITPPRGRNLFRSEMTLPVVPITWDSMISACRFAHWQATRSARQRWLKGEFLLYLKCCGISTELAEELHEDCKRFHSARSAQEQQPVDYKDPLGIGNFKFPAAWTSKEVMLPDFVETVMHQLFLGIAESNFELINKWLKESKIGEKPFLNSLQALIKDLRPFQLSWLHAYPLTGKTLGTGSWVAENWIFLVRISPFIYGWCGKDKQKASQNGADDMSRLVLSFNALVSRILTHGGMNNGLLEQTGLLMKEFLSAVREFDVRVRHEKLNAPVKNPAEKKKTEAWWLKPNYMSLFNLLYMMCMMGPACEWWDGGFKGEKIIQTVKPHIKRGIRSDSENFFVNLMNKLYRYIQLEIMEKQYGLDPKEKEELVTLTEALGEKEELVTLTEALGDLAIASSLNSETGDNHQEENKETEEEEDPEEQLEVLVGVQPDDVREHVQPRTRQQLKEQFWGSASVVSNDNIVSNDNTEDVTNEPPPLEKYAGQHAGQEKHREESRNEEDTEDHKEQEEEDQDDLTPKERLGMKKKKVFFIYRSEAQMTAAFEEAKPLSGIVLRGAEDTEEELLLLFRRGKTIHSRRVIFQDRRGKSFHSLWYAPVSLSTEEDKWSDIEEIQECANQAGVAMPLWYLLGRDDPSAKKYCVITNWWKTRRLDGTYKIPDLEPSLYGTRASQSETTSAQSILGKRRLSWESFERATQRQRTQPLKESWVEPAASMVVTLENGHQYGDL